jgi:PKD repeat protein
MTLPTSSQAIRIFIACFFLLPVFNLQGQVGKDGTRTISSANTVVNAYTSLQSNAASGSNSIQVVNNSLNLSFPAPLNSGDLIFIYQAQGADISTPDDPTYGGITSYNNSGNYEMAEVSSVSGANTINLSCPLQNNYTASGNVVVARVPRYSTLTINGGGSITCPAWNGTTGGICVLEVSGATIINSGGSIDVSGKGFRGGALVNNNSAYGVLNYRWSGPDYGAEKGESIAGDVTDYDLIGGRTCKGAPANGGGGGNGHNGGGGGGANAGNISNYTGFGIPDISNAAWIAAWNLESAGFATTTSSGGGKGGYTFSSTNQNALVTGPFNPAWGGDQRRESGGRGGRPLDYTTGKIFIGGGGGAGEQNNSKGGAGGIGGGIIYFFSYGGIAGSGQINANGANGASTNPFNGTDGAGGGGGGGTVLLNTTNPVSGITINANGGNGGSQIVTLLNTEAEGPGAGGGGGYIAISNGAVTRNAAGGINGTTNSATLTEFPPNGATKGGPGINNATINAFRVLPETLNLCSSSSTILTVNTTGTPPAGVTYTWYDQPINGNIVGTGNTFSTPVLTTSTTYYVSYCPGSARIPYKVNISSNLSVSFLSTVVCAGSSTNFSASGTPGIISWNWNFGDGTGTSIQQNPNYTYSAGGNYTVTLTVSDGTCTTSTTQTTTVNSAPVVSISSSAPSSGCGSMTVQFTNNTTNANNYSWNFGDGTSTSSQTNPVHTYSTPGSYTVVLTASSSAGCTKTGSLSIAVGPAPTASFTSNNTICQNDTVFFVNQSVGNGTTIVSQSWNFGDGSPPSSAANPYHVYTGTGTFNVTLTVSSALCTDDTVTTVSVNTGPVAGFTQSVTSGCNPLSVAFTNNTTGSPAYTWNFGDGSPVSSNQNPTHIYYTPGVYTVTLIASQGSCSDTIVQSNLIQVTNGPQASFQSLNSICLGDSSRFVNLSNGNGNTITSYSWDFGDGTFSNFISPSHLYLSQGTYSVKLITNTAFCSDDTTITVQVKSLPVVAFSSSLNNACDSATVQFTNNSTGANSYNWIFGDGNISSVASPAHLYSQAGSYTVMLTAVSGDGCSSTRASLNMVTIHSTPVVSFTATSTGVCINGCTSFNGQSSQTANAWTWSFSGSTVTSSTAQNPSNICYPVAGNFDVTLSVSNGYCSGSHTESSYIHVADCSTLPKAQFISGDTNLCSNACIDFVSLSSNTISWQWQLQGATPSTSSLEHPVNVCYNTPGIYDVVLIAGNPLGYDTIVQSGFIHVTASPAIPLITQSGNTLTSTPANSYQWYFNNVAISGAVSQQYIVQQSGNYSVTIADANGCTATSLAAYVSTTGINEVKNDMLLYVYPNPFHDEISVIIHSKIHQNLTVSLNDITGSIAFFKAISMTSEEEKFLFNLSEYASGIYFLKIQSAEYSHIRLLLKQ